MRHIAVVLVLITSLTIGASSARADSAAQIVGGADHTCALTTAGAVVCWGANFYGQLGNGTRTDSLTPTPVTGLSSGVTAIAAGHYHTCAVTAGGGVVCWGYNAEGELGNGTTTDSLTPTPVTNLGAGVAAVSAGGYHTCAVTTGGAAACWGANWFGQLGDGTTTDSAIPTAVSGLGSNARAIEAGGFYTCAVTTGGAALCWGDNVYGQLGNGTTTDSATPAPVSGLPAGVASIGVGWDHTCAVTTGGAALCWGSNWYGTLGDGTTDDRLTPTAVSGLGSGTAAVTAGTYHTCGVTTAGGVLCWGAVTYAGYGDPPVYNVTPTAVSGLESGAATVAAGGYHTCALTAGGSASCWGYNGWGQLGDGTLNDQVAPVQVVGLDGRLWTPGDFTGDGKSDLVWRHASGGDVWLWPMDGPARTAETYVRTVSDTTWEIRAVADFDGNRQTDLFWRNQVSGQLYFWPMNGSTPAAEIYVGTVDPAYDIVGTGDFNGDGKADLLWRHTALGDVWIWLMNGPTPLSETYIARVDPGYVVKGVGDVDGNGKADIVWHHATRGEVWVWPMDGTTRLSETWAGTVPDTGYQIQGVADVTGDGKADLVWHHATTGEVWIWPMDGPVRVSETWAATVPDTDYRIADTGDYDGDGKADLVWHHAVRGEVWVWIMNGTARVSETWVGTVPDTGYQIIK